MQSDGGMRGEYKKGVDEDVTSTKGSEKNEDPDHEIIDTKNRIDKGRKNKGYNSKLESSSGIRRVSKRKIDEDVSSSKGSEQEEGPYQLNIDTENLIKKGRKNKGPNTKMESDNGTRRVSKRKIDEDVTSSKGSEQEEGPYQLNIDTENRIKKGRRNKEPNTNMESDNGTRRVSKRKIDEDVTSTKGANQENTDKTNSVEKGRKSRRSDTKMESDSGKSQDLKKSTPKKKKMPKKINKRTKADKKIEEEYEVEKVIESKKSKGKLFYLIRWKGYSADSDSWEPANRLSCPDLIKKFLEEKENSKNKNHKTPTKRTKKESNKASKPSKLAKGKVSENDEENPEYEVERILEVHHKKNGKREFLIHWKGWSSKFDSWEPEDNLNCANLIEKFMNKANDGILEPQIQLIEDSNDSVLIEDHGDQYDSAYEDEDY